MAKWNRNFGPPARKTVFVETKRALPFAVRAPRVRAPAPGDPAAGLPAAGAGEDAYYRPCRC